MDGRKRGVGHLSTALLEIGMTPSKEQVHRVCQFLRDEIELAGGTARTCQQCELTVESHYGQGIPGCVLRAQQLIQAAEPSHEPETALSKVLHRLEPGDVPILPHCTDVWRIGGVDFVMYEDVQKLLAESAETKRINMDHRLSLDIIAEAGSSPPPETAPVTPKEAKIIGNFAHAILHILDDWAEEDAQTGETVVEIPADQWKEVNRVLDLLGDDPHAVLHRSIGIELERDEPDH
jgi:hypothetical protein